MRQPTTVDRVMWTICSVTALGCLIESLINIKDEPQKAIAYGLMAILFEARYWVSKYFDYRIEPENKR